MKTAKYRTEFIQASSIDEAAKKAEWAFKVIPFQDGFIAFETPMEAHLWKKVVQQIKH